MKVNRRSVSSSGLRLLSALHGVGTKAVEIVVDTIAPMVISAASKSSAVLVLFE